MTSRFDLAIPFCLFSQIWYKQTLQVMVLHLDVFLTNEGTYSLY